VGLEGLKNYKWKSGTKKTGEQAKRRTAGVWRATNKMTKVNEKTRGKSKGKKEVPGVRAQRVYGQA